MQGNHERSGPPPTVSVFVVCYNQERYIRQCLLSVLAQPADIAMEVVVGDDASTDGTFAIVSELAQQDPRIVAMRQPRNVGPGKNAKAVLEACRGEFITFCEGDDFWTHPDKLRMQLARMRSSEDFVLCFTRAAMVREDGAYFGELRPFPHSREVSFEEVIGESRGMIASASMMVRRSALIRLPQELYDQPVMDYPMQVLLAAQGRSWYEDETTCAYRTGAVGSWSESMAHKPDRFIRYHEESRAMYRFLRHRIGDAFDPNLRRALEPGVSDFYFSSRIPRSAKLRNLRQDLPRVALPKRPLIAILALTPGLSRLGSLLRRALRAARPKRAEPPL